jgi:hypothetical protein
MSLIILKGTQKKLLKFTEALKSGLSIPEIFNSLSLQDLLDEVSRLFDLDQNENSIKLLAGGGIF